jgi:Predicted ATPase (AAA+ superfamily)
MIERPEDVRSVSALIKNFPVTAILGARQVGKSTLAKSLPHDHYFDLENPRDLARLDAPQLALEDLDGTVVIDEIQRKPELFPLLRYLADARSGRRFLILGSASRDLIRQSSESLAGRIAYYELSGFRLEDVGSTRSALRSLWLRGGFPRSFLAESDDDSGLWREQFVQTYLERDLPQLGIGVSAQAMRRFWLMVAHYHGQLVNYQELSRSFGASDATVRRYLDILEGTFIVRLLRPWSGNLGKRLVKAPKLYIRDSGLFHCLQRIGDMGSLEAHPKLGASWEGFVVDQAIRVLRIKDPYFFRTHAGSEVDLVWEEGGMRFGIEAKYSDAPRLTSSMRNAVEDLSLERLAVVYPGDESYRLSPKVEVMPLSHLAAAF